MIWRGANVAHTVREAILKISKGSAPPQMSYLWSYLQWKLIDSSALAEIKVIISLQFQHDIIGTYHQKLHQSFMESVEENVLNFIERKNFLIILRYLLYTNSLYDYFWGRKKPLLF